MAYAFGQEGSFVISGSPSITFCLTDYNLTYDNGVQDLTTTCSNGFVDLGYGIRSAEGDFTAFYDGDLGSLTLLSGQNALVGEFNVGDSGNTVQATWLVKNFKIAETAKEYVKITVSLASSGTIVVTES